MYILGFGVTETVEENISIELVFNLALFYQYLEEPSVWYKYTKNGWKVRMNKMKLAYCTHY